MNLGPRGKMNLSPGRTSLSVAVNKERAAAVNSEVEKAKPKWVMERKCASCGCADRPSLVLGSTVSADRPDPISIDGDLPPNGSYGIVPGACSSPGLIAGQQAIEHFVTVELRYLKSLEGCTEYLRGRGWKPRMHQGRAAMERLLCRSCMNEHAVMEREFAQRSHGETDRHRNHQSFYQELCSE